MNNFDIFVDSGNNIPDELVKKHGIGVIPYTCIVNGEERLCYDESVDFETTAKKYYDDMRNGAEIKTSLIGKERFIEYLTPSLQAGKDAILFTIASGISGTHAQALYAKEELEKAYPSSKVYVIDTANASLGSGLLALKACEMKEAGESAEEIAKWATENAYTVNSYVTVGDLKYLRKGGRVSAVTAIAGTLLNIKPILWANDTVPAKLAVCGKERGKKKAISAIIKAFDDNVIDADKQTVAIAHADCIEDANEIAEMLKDRGVKDIIIEYYDLCTGSHAGPGTVALFFFGKSRLAEATESVVQKKPILNPFKHKVQS